LDEFGWKKYPDAKELLILCDAGGSMGFVLGCGNMRFIKIFVKFTGSPSGFATIH